MEKIDVIPLPGGVGAQIVGTDFSRELADPEQSVILDAWIRHGLLLVRNPKCDDEAQMRLSRLFGELEPSATVDLNDKDNPYLMNLGYDPQAENQQFVQHYNVGGRDRAGWLGWHWDQSFMPTIVRGAALRMTHPARLMGRTGFIDAISAYERLPNDLKAQIADLEVVYQFNPDFASGQFGFPKDIRALARVAKGGSSSKMQFAPVVHPMVIVQRETGRKLLKLSPMHARYVLGMEKADSDALLTEIAEHLVDERFAYFHDWQENDMLAWDNWRMVHCAEGVPLDCFRAARRTTIAGDYRFGRYLDPALDGTSAVRRIVD